MYIKLRNVVWKTSFVTYHNRYFCLFVKTEEVECVCCFFVSECNLVQFQDIVLWMKNVEVEVMNKLFGMSMCFIFRWQKDNLAELGVTGSCCLQPEISQQGTDTLPRRTHGVCLLLWGRQQGHAGEDFIQAAGDHDLADAATFAPRSRCACRYAGESWLG